MDLVSFYGRENNHNEINSNVSLEEMNDFHLFVEATEQIDLN